MLTEIFVWCLVYKILDEIILEAIFNWVRYEVAKSAFGQNRTAKPLKNLPSRAVCQPKKVLQGSFRRKDAGLKRLNKQ